MLSDITPTERAEVENLQPDDKIRVSNNRSLFFYVDLATKFLVDHETVEISGLGGGIVILCSACFIGSFLAIPSVVKIVEILKNQDIAKIRCMSVLCILCLTSPAISTSTTEIQGKHAPKPKIDIVVSKSDIFEKVKAEKDLLVCIEPSF
jgi:hypothetical protein